MHNMLWQYYRLSYVLPILQSMEKNIRSTAGAIHKRKIKFLRNVLLPTNALCKTCREFAENELQGQ